jgi:hypothetical protein
MVRTHAGEVASSSVARRGVKNYQETGDPISVPI